MTKTWTVDEVREMLKTNQSWMERATVVLHDRQTTSEQATRDTRYLNMKGFNSADAKRMSKNAEWLKSGRHLSGWHKEQGFKRIPKYAKQITAIINGESI